MATDYKNHDLLTPGQEGKTGNDRGMTEAGLDKDHGNMDHGAVGGAQHSEITNTGGSSASEGGMGSGNKESEDNSNAGNNSNMGNEKTAEQQSDQSDAGAQKTGEGKDGAVAGNS